MYSNKILEIFKSPKNAGGLQGSNGIGKYKDEECGDVVKIYLKIDDNKVIGEAQFKTMGSAGSIVASDAICDIVVGLSIDQAKQIKAGDVLEVTGEYPSNKLYTIDFAIKALNLAIDDYFERLEKEQKNKSVKKEKKAKIEKQNEISTDFKIDDNENLFSDQIPAPEKKPDLFEKYFADLERNAEIIANQNIENREKVTITKTTQETLNLKATRLIEEAKTYSPIIETKIIKDEDLPKSEIEVVVEEKNKISKAKAMFDAMFEE